MGVKNGWSWSGAGAERKRSREQRGSGAVSGCEKMAGAKTERELEVAKIGLSGEQK